MSRNPGHAGTGTTVPMEETATLVRPGVPVSTKYGFIHEYGFIHGEKRHLEGYSKLTRCQGKTLVRRGFDKGFE